VRAEDSQLVAPCGIVKPAKLTKIHQFGDCGSRPTGRVKKHVESERLLGRLGMTQCVKDEY